MKLRAPYVYLPEGAWLEDGVVEIDDDTELIREVRRRRPAESPRELTDVGDYGGEAILPGLINAHCHLEYSWLKGRLRGDQPFTDWLLDIFRHSRETPVEERRAALPEAFRQLRASGTTTLCDNLTTDVTADFLRNQRTHNLLLFEGIESRPEHAGAAFAALCARVDGEVGRSADAAVGYAPHAPHSVSPALLKAIVRRAQKENRVVSIHAAETPEEVEMFRRGRGPLLELKREFGTLPADWTCPELSPVQYLDSLGAVGPRTLLVHANEPQTGDADLIARAGASVVYCPGTHRYFGRAPYPLAAYLERGVNVCIGTDSLASNGALDLTRELALAHADHPAIPAERLLDMVTRNAARALGLADRGTVAPGRLAELSLWAWPYADLAEWLEDDDRVCLNKIRSTKLEIRNKFKGSKFKYPKPTQPLRNAAVLDFGHSDF